MFVILLSLNLNSQDLELEGSIKIGSSQNQSPVAGTIRWNDITDEFEGYNGEQWVSLSRSNEIWGFNQLRTFEESDDLYPLAGSAEDCYGRDIDVHNNDLIVGAWGFDVNGGTNSGKAFIYEISSDTLIEKACLMSPNSNPLDYFGRSVSIYGDWAAVGSYLEDVGGNVDQGAVYMYHFDGANWSLDTTLHASDGSAEDFFGYSIDIHDDIMVIGADRFDNGAELDQGKAYVFKLSGGLWNETDGFLSSDGEADDRFGIECKIYDNTIVIGAYLDDHNGLVNSGSAYVFEVDANGLVSQSQKLVATDLEAGDFFGRSVAVYDDVIIIGSYLHDSNNITESGQVYSFVKDNASWYQSDIISSNEASEGDRLGRCVEICGKYMVAGAFQNDVNNLTGEPGVAYLFERNGDNWQKVAKFTPSDATGDDFFGYSVSINHAMAIIGAYRHDTNGNTDQGKVYLYIK